MLACAVAPDGLVSWWDGDGTAEDIHRANHGTLRGARFAEGQVGQAFRFDGRNDFVSIESNDELNPRREITLDAWVLVTDDSGEVGDIITKDGEDSSRQFILGVAQGTRKFTASIGVPGGLVTVVGQTMFELNQWYHVATTYNGRTVRLYVDGQRDASVSATGTIIRGRQPVRIGGGAPQGRQQFFFRGLIDEARLFDRALTADEVAAIFSAGSDGNCKLENKIRPGGELADEQTSIVYHASTGEVEVDAPAGSVLNSVNIVSVSGIFTADPPAQLGGSFDVDNDMNIFKATFGDTFGSLSFGKVAQPLLSEAFLLQDLAVNGSGPGLDGLGPVDLVYVQPSLPPTGQIGDDITSIVYDVSTGEVSVDAPAGIDFSSINIVSKSGIFTQDAAQNLGGSFDIDNDTSIFKAVFGGSFGSLSFGNVAEPLLGLPFLSDDLSVDGTFADSSLIEEADLIYVGSGLLPDGRIGDERVSIIYDASTGRVEVDPPASIDLSSINIVSASSIFTGAPASNLGGTFDVDNDMAIFKATFGGSFGRTNFGNVAQAGLDLSTVIADLTVDGTFADSDLITSADLIYIPAGILANGVENDGQTSIIYDAGTGQLGVDAPSGVNISSINIVSASGIFNGDPVDNLGGAFDIDNDTTIFKASLAGGFSSLSFGRAAESGLSEQFIVTDLTVDGQLVGGNDLGDVDLIYRLTNSLPTIGMVANQIIDEDTSTDALAVIVGDAESPVQSLTLTGTSSNTNVIPNENITILGSGATRTVTVLPGKDRNGTVTVTLSVRDPDGGMSKELFDVVIRPVNDSPTITVAASRTVDEDAPTFSIPFVISDLETDARLLAVSASSSNNTLVPNSGLSISGSGTDRSLSVRLGQNQSGTAQIALTVTDPDDETVSASIQLTVNPLNDSPIFGGIGNITTNEDTTVGPVSFTVTDVESPAATLTVSASSSNTQLLPNTGIALGGTGSSRTFSATPTPGASGSTRITLTARDSQGGVGTASFLLAIVAVNDRPTISSIDNQSVLMNETAGPIEFTIGDEETDVNSLRVVATSSTALVPSTNITLGGSGAIRTLTLVPATNQTGAATFTVSVFDGDGASASTTFSLMVGTFVPLAGDGNADREFNQLDIVLALQGGKYLTGLAAIFAQGDWNRDGIFDQRDVVAALQTGNYLQGPYAARTETLTQVAPANHDVLDVALEDLLEEVLAKNVDLRIV